MHRYHCVIYGRMMPIVLYRGNRLILRKVVEGWMSGWRKLALVCLAELVTLKRLRRSCRLWKLLRNRAIRLGGRTLVLIIGRVLRLTGVLIQRMFWLSLSLRLLISRMRSMLRSRVLVLELLSLLLLLHSRSLYEALRWLKSMLVADQRRIVLGRRLRRIR
jgi:hypothetical protein